MKAILGVLAIAVALSAAAASARTSAVAAKTCGHDVAAVVGGKQECPRGRGSTVRVRRSRLSLAGIPQENRTLGDPRAPAVMVVWEDPQCPVCLEWHQQVLPALVRKYVRTDKLQIQWHGFAVIGSASLTGEEFVFAAGLQNHLWDMIDDIMANQGQENGGWLSDSLAERIGALTPGFNVSAEMADLHSETVINEINGDQRHGARIGLEGVPFIELGRRNGPIGPLDAQPYEPRQFEGPINRLLRHR